MTFFFKKQDNEFQIQKLTLVVCFLLSLIFFQTNCSTAKTELSDTDKQIKFYKERIGRSKNHYPSYALLANAYLAKTRETGNPQFLKLARQNVHKSLEIQANYQAMKTMSLISNYSHRFAEAVEWGEKTAQTSPEGLSNDSEVSSILIEAYLGLGQNEKAEQILNQLAKNRPDDFSTFASQGLFYKAENKVDDAVKAFAEAAKIAGIQNAREWVVWANVSAAACYIDSNRAVEAQPFLQNGKNIAPENRILNIHQAEFLFASNRPQEALEIYNTLLKTNDDPEIHHLAFLIAQKFNDKNLAETHFQAAVEGFRRVLNSGEIYTLEPLAQIYCDANKNLPEAEKIARQNLEYKKDRSANKTLKCVTEKLRPF